MTKLIEVYFPVSGVGLSAFKERSISNGHHSTFHLWAARRPLSVCRALLFASIVDDPSSRPDKFPTEDAQEKERQRLIDIVCELAKTDTVKNNSFLDEVKKEIGKDIPIILDPFCGGATIPIEIIRLGLNAQASDLNPIPVLMTLALTYIPAKFGNIGPVNNSSENIPIRNKKIKGLLQDVFYYGSIIYEQVKNELEYMYPHITLPAENGVEKKPVTGWMYHSMIKCPECKTITPIVRDFMVCDMKNNFVWLNPIVRNKEVLYVLRYDKKNPPPGTLTRTSAICFACKKHMSRAYIKDEAKKGNVVLKMIAMHIKNKSKDIFLLPTEAQIKASQTEKNICFSNITFYELERLGFKTFDDLFLPRQLYTLTAYSNMLKNIYDVILQDAQKAGLKDDGKHLIDCGEGATAYADAIITYYAFILSRMFEFNSVMTLWRNKKSGAMNVLFKYAHTSKSFDVYEINPFGNTVANFKYRLKKLINTMENIPVGDASKVELKNAINAGDDTNKYIIFTDPPYYDIFEYGNKYNIFYVMLKRNLKNIYPNFFISDVFEDAGELVPIADKFDRDYTKAHNSFKNMFEEVWKRFYKIQHPDYPLVLFYAHKKIKKHKDGLSISPGWEAMLEGLINAGFRVIKTWTIKMEKPERIGVKYRNALTAATVLVCRPRISTRVINKEQFKTSIQNGIPKYIRFCINENISPVDIQQAIFGWGAEEFTKYAAVINDNNKKMTIGEALFLVNDTFEKYLQSQKDMLDSISRFCVEWYEKYGFESGPLHEAELLALKNNIFLPYIKSLRLLEIPDNETARLISCSEYPDMNYKGPIAWANIHVLIKNMQNGMILNGIYLDDIKMFAYMLYNIASEKNWHADCKLYNELIITIEKSQTPSAEPPLSKLFTTM